MQLNVYDRLYLLIGVPWLFLMLFTSGQYTVLKAVLLVSLTIISYNDIKSSRIKINVKYTNYVRTFWCFCAFSLLLGLVLGYDFRLEYDYVLFQYYFATPLCIVLLTTSLSQRKRSDFLWEVLTFFTLLLVILDLLKLYLYMAGLDPAYLKFIMISSGNSVEELTLRVSNESSFFFLLPIFLYLTVNPLSKKFKDRFIPLAITLLGLVYCILSGRKMLELLMVLGLLFSLTYKSGHLRIKNLFSGKLFKIFAALFVLFLTIGTVFTSIADLLGIDNILELAQKTIEDGFSSDSHGVSKRVGNTAALLEMWFYSPIFGHGLNSYAVDSRASIETPWSYEVFYNAWLAQTGLIGCYLLYRPIRYICKMLIKAELIYADKRCPAILLGFICFLLGGASNPMLIFVWPWTIALLFGNRYSN